MSVHQSCKVIEPFMPDLASRLPETWTETFDQAFGPMRASVPTLTNDSQIGSDLRVWADEDD